MKRILSLCIPALAMMMAGCSGGDNLVVHNDLRAPAYPLVTIDPYTSVWSMTDNLYDSPTQHWTEKDFPLTGVLKVDGTVYRFMGTDDIIPSGIPTDEEQTATKSGWLETTAVQTSVDVQATSTVYTFSCGPVNLTLTFTAPLFLDDLELISRPVNYISYRINPADGKKHDLALYLEASPLWALNTPDQECESEAFSDDALIYLKSGSKEQNMFEKFGDNVRIEWGYFYLAAEKGLTTAAVGSSEALRAAFATGQELPQNTSGENADAQMALVRELGSTGSAEGKFLIGYDDIYSVQYFGENLRPYWNRAGDKTIQDEFHAALKDYDALVKRGTAFDRQLMAEATEAGGKKYADLCVLAYRQSIAAHKLVESSDGELHFFSKENSSGGYIGTVDITYPTSPMLLYYNPELAKALLNHIYYYSETGRWEKPFPAHDVGRYPLANGQSYPKDMPVEEDGNMLIVTAVVCRTLGEASYAEKHWDILTTWVNYLVEYGLDPEDQLCTDDFAGHLARNVNLSAKAILGIASYGMMAQMLGKDDTATEYLDLARSMAGQWMEMASAEDHYKLTFDQDTTWSQKYNLIWDKMFGLDIFPQEVYDTELAYYRTVQNEYGLPLDSRKTYTKTDWIMWTATMAEDQAIFDALIDPVYDFMNRTVDRVPMTDWYWTDSLKHQNFKARAVVGGYYMKLLRHRGL